MGFPSLPSPPDITGITTDGDYCKTVHLRSADGMQASILTLGARLLDLRLSDNRPLTLPFCTLDDVEADDAYVGAVIGRTANRIRGGKLLAYKQVRQDVTLELNEGGKNHTHGGRRGWTHRMFAVRERSESMVELFLFSPDGDQRYPASVEVTVRYELTGKGELAVELVTKNAGKESTVTNMTLHTYFDLSGQMGSVGNSALAYNLVSPLSQHHLVLDEDNVPTGEISPVAGTKFDFTEKRSVGDTEDPFTGIDNYFVACQPEASDSSMQSLLTMSVPAGEHGAAVALEVLSNQPGFQLYTANGFDGTGPGAFAKCGSIAVEPSGYIDATNNGAFPSIELGPSETRRQLITYRFTCKP